MNPGIIYYNMGRKNLARLCVSLYTLRQVYDGPVAVLFRDKPNEPPRWFKRLVKKLGAEMIRVDMGDASALTAKASLWRYSPFDPTLYLDADTVVLEHPKQLLDLAADGAFVTTQFCEWGTNSRRIGGRIRAWSPLLSDNQLQAALDYGRAVNTGVVAWRSDNKFLPWWEKYAQAGWAKKCTRRMVDELACQVLLSRFEDQVDVLPDGWNWSPKFSKERSFPIAGGGPVKPGIVHFHGYKHVHPYPMCVYWKCMWHAMRKKYDIKPDGDRRLTRYVNEYPEGLTLCTVVSDTYRAEMERNAHLWANMAGLKGNPLIVFRVGDTIVDIPDGLFPEVKIVDVCKCPTHLSLREHCLSQYVYGPAKHVKTSHWMKLDADCTPKTDTFKMPDYHGYAIAAHRWGYTRVKGDSDAKKHWLNSLDDWYWGKPVNYPSAIPVRARYGHKRHNSYCAIYQTSFTQQVALKCPDRLPVPSEDTTTHYLAEQWHLPVRLYNAKRYFSQ